MSENLQQVFDVVRQARRDYLKVQTVNNDKVEELFDELLFELLGWF